MNAFIRKSIAAAAALSLAAAFTGCENKASSGSSDPSSSEIQFVTNPDEEELGAYTVSSSGVKLYYDPEEISPEIMSALESYFLCFERRDYDTYLKLAQPDYVECMQNFLQTNYEYDLEHSFNGQCDNFEENAGQGFKITRIKAEISKETTNTDGSVADRCKAYIDDLGELFETDLYDTVSKNSDKLHSIIFYIMAEADGEEFLLYSEYEIVLSEKDGKFYTFG